MTIPAQLRRERSLHPELTDRELVARVAAANPQCSPRWITVTLKNVKRAAKKQLMPNVFAPSTG